MQGPILLAVFAAGLASHGAAGHNCTAGVSDGHGVCCSRECGKCNQLSCDTMPGGPPNCCHDEIGAECVSVEGPPPCIYPRDFRPRCTDGVMTAAGDACCHESCGQCGGPGCQDRPGGESLCCPEAIRDECSSHAGPPPCRYPLAWFSRCLSGIESEDGHTCCDKACGKCGGAGCEDRPGGAAYCCEASIQSRCTNAAGPPPCSYAPDWRPRCTRGILSASGDTCCPASCGLCDTNSCDAMRGGPRECCRDFIGAECHNMAGPPPCVYKRSRAHEL